MSFEKWWAEYIKKLSSNPYPFTKEAAKAAWEASRENSKE